ncbi:hypothetical protein BS47DRAFT_1335601 [Hydnum rufescens UP504]|uniref:Cns1/TTC4 wheel domain-containing protein n=1 Tax=Hydnum rufescens UP504 TaxID=1448309 RepID=A0A9P6BB83_9AGAM|nr:hypothetical protein BS47DRAFT_1335601 [Hydnum rufescens UP504]
MTFLPDDTSSNEQLEALQSLIFDEEPNVAALNFKDHGNDCFKERRYRDALGFYTQGISVNPDDNVLLEALLCNRAACNLELREKLRICYTRLCRALGINPRSAKALYRSAKALVKLDRLNEALDACNRCLGMDESNDATRDLVAQIKKTLAQRDAIEREKQRRAKEKEEEDNILKVACTARHLTQIIFPVLLLYPQYSTSDFIKSFAEHTTFREQIEVVFPADGPPANWDVKREYRIGNLSVYAVTRRKMLLKVGLKMTLADLFLRAGTSKVTTTGPSAGTKHMAEADGLEVKDGCLSFVLVPRGNVEQGYVDTFKANRDGHAK